MQDDPFDLSPEEQPVVVSEPVVPGWVPPGELVEYLLTLISPPDERAAYIADLNLINWQEIADTPDNTFCGLLTRGTPTEAQANELYRVLRPGAHLLLIAPDSEPWGATGACRIEDSGFDIRDAIAVALPLDELAKLPSRSEPPRHPFHYTPKAARGERELGCNSLGEEPEGEELEEEDGCDDCAGQRIKQMNNTHPTVKPIELMVRLLHDVPKAPENFQVPVPTGDTKASDVLDPYQVLDPFLGSGSTGLACLETGHNFRGMEREKAYLKIATARTRLWVNKIGGGKGKATLLGDRGNRPVVISDVGDSSVLESEKPQEKSELDVFF